MKSTAVIISLISAVVADAVTESIAPTGSYPSGCSRDFTGDFELSVTAVTNAKRDLAIKKRSSSCGADGILLVSLADGVLTDAKNRTGYIASNYQFQFDGPPQDGAIYTAGFSVCGNESLALGDTTTFWECASGSFWNLYDRNWAAQCSEVQLIVLPCDDSSDSEVSESSDGQVVATSQITTTVVKSITDGQVQVITTTVGIPLCQITDGQAQVQTTPCASITTTAAVTTAVPISQYSDGQIQVTTPVTAATTAVATATATTTAVGSYTTTAVGSYTTTAASSYVASLTPSKSSNGTSLVTSRLSTSASTTTGTTSGTTSAATTSTTAVISGALRVSASSFATVVIGLISAIVFL